MTAVILNKVKDLPENLVILNEVKDLPENLVILNEVKDLPEWHCAKILFAVAQNDK